jgi:hypothetical protein
MLKIRFWIFLIFLIAGCLGKFRGEEALLRESFRLWKKGLLQGDIKMVYELTSSASKKGYTFEKWEKEYLANKERWKRLFSDARVLLIAIEGNEASLLIRLSTGELRMLTAVKEEGRWRIGKPRE